MFLVCVGWNQTDGLHKTVSMENGKNVFLSCDGTKLFYNPAARSQPHLVQFVLVGWSSLRLQLHSLFKQSCSVSFSFLAASACNFLTLFSGKLE